MSGKHTSVIAAIGIDIGKNWFHVVGLDGRGAVALRRKWSRGQMRARLAKMPPGLIGMKARVRAGPGRGGNRPAVAPGRPLVGAGQAGSSPGPGQRIGRALRTGWGETWARVEWPIMGHFGT